MCWDPAFKSPNFQIRRGISQNNTTSAATILYWYFFSDHNRHTLPLLLISVCNIGNNIATRYNLLVLLVQQVNILRKCIPIHITISQKKILERQTDKRVNGSHYLLDFHLFFIFISRITLGMCIILGTACCHTSLTVMMYAKYFSVKVIFCK